MFCGGCFRDNALVAALRQLGHATTMVPLYLEQKSGFFRNSPKWLHRLLDSPGLLNLAAGSAAKTRPEDVGELTLSMARGENGFQARELEELIAWLKQNEHPDVICLSNALLIGMARRIKSELRAPVLCMLQGEDWFLDALPTAQREQTWATLIERARDIDLFIAPSRYFAAVMSARLKLRADQIQVIYNGISLTGYTTAASPPNPPVLGYFSRMSQIKGLDTLVEAFIHLKTRDRVKDLKLRVGGGMSPADEKFVGTLRERMKAHGCLKDAEFHPNLDRAAKVDFFRSLSVMSAPALYGEAFGLYVIESLAAGVPVVQPRHAAFPELIAATGGGVLCEPNDPLALALAIEELLLDPERLRALGQAGRAAVLEKFSAERMARDIAQAYQTVASRSRSDNASIFNSQF
ncbi:MAG: glycosyltransferase family 4 protein [Verrucomicrobia bacterium]|nr:glycosyltransferase family 4 protein [Verrucomicrobiota bacterium]